MTLKQLEAFYWAATCISFAVAAERSHISGSTLSKRLAELETSLGHPLFEKSGRHAELTVQGERLLPLAREMLGQAACIRAEIGKGTGLAGRLRLGMGEMSSMTWLPRLLSQAAQLHPDQLWAEDMARLGQLVLLAPDDEVSPLEYVLQWRRDDARQLIADSRQLVAGLVEFTTPRCFVPQVN